MATESNKTPLKAIKSQPMTNRRRWIDRFRSRAFLIGLWLGLIAYLIWMAYG
jgi:hypothetical protein